MPCEHGQQARACSICERDREIKELRNMTDRYVIEIERLQEQVRMLGENLRKERRSHEDDNRAWREHVDQTATEAAGGE